MNHTGHIPIIHHDVFATICKNPAKLATINSHAARRYGSMPDEIIDHDAACMVQAEARRTWRVVGWIISANHPDHPGRFVARLLSGHPSPYVILDDTLTGLRAQLPPGLQRQPACPQDAIEIWFAL